jgi:hypothetical protein
VNTLEVSTVLPNQSIFFRLLHEQKNILALKMSVTEGFGPKKFETTTMYALIIVFCMTVDFSNGNRWDFDFSPKESAM